MWDITRYGDTINEWAVRILLECILVDETFYHFTLVSMNCQVLSLPSKNSGTLLSEFFFYLLLGYKCLW